MGSIPKDLAGGANSFLVVLTLLEKGKNMKMTKLLPIKAYPFTRKQRAIISCQKKEKISLKVYTNRGDSYQPAFGVDRPVS